MQVRSGADTSQDQTEWGWLPAGREEVEPVTSVRRHLNRVIKTLNEAHHSAFSNVFKWQTHVTEAAKQRGAPKTGKQ